jgi:chromosome partitioning protein
MADGARVVVFASQKGGSGKTTLSGHVAVEAERMGDGPVALIDTDPQGSLAKWWNARTSETPAFAHAPLAELETCVNHLKSIGFKLICVDTPPAVTETISNVVAHADLVVVPTRPSPHDLRAVGPTVDLVESLRKPLIFVINSATPRARITSETAVALSQHGVVAPVTLHHRVDFAASMIDGRTVGEIRPDSKSAKEIASLWLYVRERLARLDPTDAHWTQGPRGDFATARLTPASAFDPTETAELADAPESVEPAVEPEMADEADLPAWADMSRVLAAVKARQAEEAAIAAAGGAPAAPVSELPTANSNWDGVDRRRADRGPPTGQADRRTSPVFGRRAIR